MSIARLSAMPEAISSEGPITALLLAGGAANGLAYRMIDAGKDRGSDAPLEFFRRVRWKF